MIDLDADVVPGEAVAGLLIGATIEGLLSKVRPKSTETLGEQLKYDFGSVKVWTDKNRIVQIELYSGYRGSLRGFVHIGSTIAEIEHAFGQAVEEDEYDNLIVRTIPGWCFETEEWEKPFAIENNREARVSEMFVFDTKR